jgi:hypothetical protein
MAGRGSFRPAALEALEDALDHDEALRRDAALSAVEEARGGAGLRRALEVGILEDDVGIAAAQLEHGLLEAGARLRGHRPPGRRAAGEGDRGDLGCLHESGDPRRAHEQRAERVARHPGFVENLLDGESAAGDVGGVLEQTHVPCRERRRGEAKDLPEGEVPRHDGEDEAERLEGHVAPRGVGRRRLRREKVLCVLRVVLAHPGALVGLGPPLGHGLAHLEGHEAGEPLAFSPQERAGAPQGRRALGEGGRSKAGSGGERRGRLLGCLVVLADQRPGRVGG